MLFLLFFYRKRKKCLRKLSCRVAMALPSPLSQALSIPAAASAWGLSWWGTTARWRPSPWGTTTATGTTTSPGSTRSTSSSGWERPMMAHQSQSMAGEPSSASVTSPTWDDASFFYQHASIMKYWKWRKYMPIWDSKYLFVMFFCTFPGRILLLMEFCFHQCSSKSNTKRTKQTVPN